MKRNEKFRVVNNPRLNLPNKNKKGNKIMARSLKKVHT